MLTEHDITLQLAMRRYRYLPTILWSKEWRLVPPPQIAWRETAGTRRKANSYGWGRINAMARRALVDSGVLIESDDHYSWTPVGYALGLSVKVTEYAAPFIDAEGRPNPSFQMNFRLFDFLAALPANYLQWLVNLPGGMNPPNGARVMVDMGIVQVRQRSRKYELGAFLSEEVLMAFFTEFPHKLPSPATLLNPESNLRKPDIDHRLKIAAFVKNNYITPPVIDDEPDFDDTFDWEF